MTYFYNIAIDLAYSRITTSCKHLIVLTAKIVYGIAITKSSISYECLNVYKSLSFYLLNVTIHIKQ